MDMDFIKKCVRNEVIKKYIELYSEYYVPIAVSNRHVHICSDDLEKLFGRGYK